MEVIRRLGDAAELHHHEAADGAEVTLLLALKPGDVKGLFELVHRQHAIHEGAPVLAAHDAGLLPLGGRVQLAHDGGQEVVERDETLESAVLVHHQGHVHGRTPEAIQSFEGRRPLGQVERGPQRALQVQGLPREARREQFLRLYNPHDVVQASAAHGEPGMKAPRDLALDFGGRVIDAQPDHLAARSHERGHLAVP